jgi:hypothetical protein
MAILIHYSSFDPILILLSRSLLRFARGSPSAAQKITENSRRARKIVGATHAEELKSD